MEISLANIGKRFQREWIFRNVTTDFKSGSHCAVLGGNGSGKSTLLQIISGFLTPGEGEVIWKWNNSVIKSDEIYRYVSIATPYMNLYDDFTLNENISFFLQFKNFRNRISVSDFVSVIQLENQQDKQLGFYSSGMRQRVKLGLAILADTPLLLLDEPTSHLDANAINWFQNLLAENAEDRTLFVASNSHQDEIFLCTENLSVESFKS